MAAVNSIKKAVFINMASKYSAALIQLAYTVILARLLTPDAFGIVAIAQVFVTFFNIFADMGLGTAVIQRQDLDDEDVSKLFGFTVVLAAALGLIFVALGWPLRAIYATGELLGVCHVLAFAVVLATLNTVPNALLMKQMRFVSVGVRQVVAGLAASVIGIGSAALGADYFAIAIYSVTNALIVFVWNYASNRVAPRFAGMLGAVRKVYSYSAYLFGFNLINYFSRNMDNLLVGYFFGTASLGNYSKAYQLMTLPQTYLTNIVTSVMHPILAKRQDETDYIYSVFVKTVKMLSLIGVFVTTFCFFCAEEVIVVMYGDQWVEAVPCLQLLSVSIWSQMVCGSSGSMFAVLNRTKEQFIRGALIAAVILAAIFAGVASGSVANVALFVGLAYYIAFLLMLPFLIKRSFGKSMLGFLRVLLPDLLLATCMCVAFWALNHLHLSSAFVSFAVKLAVGLLLYVVLLVVSRQLRWFLPVLPFSLRRKLPPWLTGEGGEAAEVAKAETREDAAGTTPNMSRSVAPVVESGLCTSCGLCAAACPIGAVTLVAKDGSLLPVVEGCVECGRCLRVCPGKGGSLDDLSGNLSERMSGPCLLATSAWSKNERTFENSVSGGVVTQLVSTLLAEGAYDGAFLVGDAVPGGFSAAEHYMADDDLLTTQKSKYVQVSHEPTLRFMKGHPDERLIVVGTPCAVRGLLNAVGELRLARENYLFIGLFCDKTMTANVLDYLVRKSGSDAVLAVDFCSKAAGGWPGNVRVRLDDGEVCDFDKSVRMAVKEYFQPECCLYCLDKLNVHADVSVGDDYTGDGANPEGACSVIVRTEQGLAAWHAAERQIGCVESSIAAIAQSQHLDARVQNLAFSRLKMRRGGGCSILASINDVPGGPSVAVGAAAGEAGRAYDERLRKIRVGMAYGHDPTLLEREVNGPRAKLRRLVGKGKRAIKRLIGRA